MGLFDLLSDIVSSSVDSYKRNVDEVARKKEREINRYESSHGKSTQTEAARRKVEKMRSGMEKISNAAHGVRRTDGELREDKSGMDKNPRDYSYESKVDLKAATNSAPSGPGVYILWLNGKAMKCGRAVYAQGIRWRFTQYYNLNYDDRARNKDYWSVSPDNRDNILVSWQACPVSQCEELEAKLFQKYGKGDWARRAPSVSGRGNWPLLI